MALVLKDRVKETTTTAGTGTVTLAGAVSGFQSFAAIGNGNETYYAIADSVTGDWEVGIGTYTSSGTTLSRTTVLSSSNGGSLVPFAANVKDVFVTYPSSRSVNLDTAGAYITPDAFNALNAVTANLTTANITAGTVTTTPTSSNDIANKSYVDGLVTSGITYHAPVKYEVPVTTGNLNAIYNQPGGPGVGVGATLTNNGTLAAFAPDGPTAAPGDRILVYNQTNAFENGVYTVTTVGSGSVAWVLTRATDADTYAIKNPNGLGNGDAFFVTSGNTGAGETYVCNTVGTITFGTTNIVFVQISSAQIYSAGTGLTLSNLQFSITNTGVSAATYGSASAVPVFAVNAQGQITSVTNTTIAINGSQVSGAIVGPAGSVANALTAGSYLTSGGTYNGSVARTFAVDATPANTFLKVVARDADGNFSASIITADLDGTATRGTNIAGGLANQIPYQTAANTTSFIVAPTASNQVLNWNGSAFTWSAGTISGIPLGSNLATLTLGAYLTGTSYNGSTAVTAAVDATSANTASKVVARDASGNFSAGTITASLSGNASTASQVNNSVTFNDGGAGGASGSTFNGSGALTVSYNTVGAPSTTGTNATGTWGINISGNAATSTTAANVNNGTLTLAVSGTGLSGSQTFTANQATNATFTVTSNATSANTASTIVARDASGDFSAGTITATLNGNASTATSATTATTATNLAGGSAGTIPYQSATSTTAQLAAGTSGQYLQSNGAAAPSWVTPPTIGNGTLTLAVSGTGLSGSQTFTANQTGNATFTVASNATSANTASTIVARDASGDFSAGIITASLSGNATTATTATNLAGGSAGTVPYQSAANTTVQLAAGTSGQVLKSNGAAAPSWVNGTISGVSLGSNLFTLTMGTSGTGLSGSTTYNGSGAATFTVTSNATSANTAATIVARDASGNFTAGTITATLNGNATNVSGTVAIANGGTGQTTANTAFNALVPSQTGNAGKYLTTDGTNTSWAASGGGGSLTVTNDVATATDIYPLLATATSGTISAVNTSNANLLYTPSTGEFKAEIMNAMNGIFVNSATITTSYTIASGNNAMTAGPVTVGSGITVTVSSGSVWTVV